MKHLIVCGEYPPTPNPTGGIGTYVDHISRLLAESGEVVHVISQLWQGAAKEVEERCNGRLIIHRVPFDGSTSQIDRKLHRTEKSNVARSLYKSVYAPQCFSWQAGLLAERLVTQEGIDIIEAQEYEAPLYFFQLRRALGLGPKIFPPCIIQLHSSTEFIAHHDDRDPHHVYFQTAKRLEDYSIASADALVCPSQYLALQAEAHYDGLAAGFVHVIPYPIGETTMLDRNRETWEQGTICYTGRLERRKGVLEWIDAAVAVAYDYPTARFEFIGANILGIDGFDSEELVQGKIPLDLRERFIFRGQQHRSLLPGFLANARIAVVPSRWENFPNTCIEAMCSGLPVLATRQGGMIEMIEDGRTGWLVMKADKDELAEGLRRALDMPPMALAEMGRRAATEIRRICDNGQTVERHLRFREHLVHKARSRRSLHLPINLLSSGRSVPERTNHSTLGNNSQEGLAVVIICRNNGPSLHGCLRSLEHQTRKPIVVIVDDGSDNEETLQTLDDLQRNGWRVLRQPNSGSASAKNAGIRALLGSGLLTPLALAFLDAEDRLRPNFVAACEGVFLRCQQVGLVSCWAEYSQDGDNVWSRPCPGFPYQWSANDVVPFAAVRKDAFVQAGGFRHSLVQGYDDWDLANAVMAEGWVAITFPDILGECRRRERKPPCMVGGHTHSRMRGLLLDRFPELVSRDAKVIMLMEASNRTWSFLQELSAVRDRLETAEAALRRPHKAVQYVFRKAKRRILGLIPRRLL